MDRERIEGDHNKSKTLGPVASLLAANHDRNNKLGNGVIPTPYASAAGMLLHIHCKWKNLNYLFCSSFVLNRS